MKRFLTFFLAVITAVVLLCGCGSADISAGPSDSPAPPTSDEAPAPDISLPEDPPESLPPAEPVAPSVPPSNADAPNPIEQPTPDAPASGAAYIGFYDLWLPLSVVKEGENMLSGTDWWYFDAITEAEKMGIPTAEEGVITDLENGESCHRISVKGWEAAAADMVHTVYTPENQPLYADWDEFIYTYIAMAYPEFRDITPIIYTESWSFDLDGDGLEDHLVNTSNFCRLEEGGSTEPNPPAAENTLLYSFSTLFYGSGYATVLFADAFEFENGAPVSGEEELMSSDAVFYSYRVDENSSPYTECYTFAWQYDGEGYVQRCPIYSTGEFDTLSRRVPAIFDADGDGETELVTWGSNVYSPINVYDVAPDGIVTLYLSYWTPA